MNKNKLVFNALGIALVFVVTAMITLPMPGAGYINIGDSVLLLFASVSSPISAFIIGGVGSALADLFLGYTNYALFTLVVKGIEALLVVLVIKGLKKISKNTAYAYIIAFIIAVLWMILGYMITANIMYSSFETALTTLPGNFTQGGISAVIAIIGYEVFKKIVEHFPKFKTLN